MVPTEFDTLIPEFLTCNHRGVKNAHIIIVYFYSNKSLIRFNWAEDKEGLIGFDL